jgi:NAD(P)H-hydrate epimerase
MAYRILSREAIREVDRRAIDEYGMTSLVLMENAGRGCADVLCAEGIGGPVVVGCGKGNNGGDGLVLARHLDLRGHVVRVLLWCAPSELTGDAAANHAIAVRGGLLIREANKLSRGELAGELQQTDWVVDALLGTGARGEPWPPYIDAIQALNAAPGRRLAVDIPSGLDCDTGRPASNTVRADVTCTFVARKPGFEAPEAAPFLGRVHVLDIGAPRRLVDEVAADFCGS